MVFSDIAQKAFSGLTLGSSFSPSQTSGTTTPKSPAELLTLEMVLSNQTSSPFSLQDFSEYLKTTYCNENLLFYQAVTDYKSRCIAYFGVNNKLQDGFDFTTIKAKAVLTSREKKLWFETLKNKFEIILQDFILSDAPQEINIPYEIRHQLLHAYQIQQSYHPALLYPACHAVVDLLRISAFIPFVTDPNRLLLVVKKKKSFKRQKSVPNIHYHDELLSLPPITTNESIIPTSSNSTGFLKRIITASFNFRHYPSATEPLDSPPMSPPTTITTRLSSWRQHVNIPDTLQSTPSSSSNNNRSRPTTF